jgi:hypothetical protein
MNDVCTCGDTGYHWLADENQAEANCWQCYYKAEEMHYYEETYEEEIKDYNTKVVSLLLLALIS